MSTFLIGATGKTGSLVARSLVSEGRAVLGLHRRDDQAAALRDGGVTPVHGDLTAVDSTELSRLMRGATEVVFTAGAGGGGDALTDAIDGEGLVKAAAAAEQAGVRRFVLVSVFPDAWRDRGMPEEFEHYMQVKKQADVHLASSSLDWVIVRPGTLTDDPGTGTVRMGPAVPYGEIPREDLAAVLVAILQAPGVSREIIEVTSGDIATRTAVAAYERFARSRAAART